MSFFSRLKDFFEAYSAIRYPYPSASLPPNPAPVVIPNDLPSEEEESSNSEYSPPKLGELSRKYEVGRGGCGTISSGEGDPGGKSYGLWQLSSKAGTLQTYINESRWKIELSSCKIASNAFDNVWKLLAADYTVDFTQEQWQFIKRNFFNPCYDYWINELKMKDDPTIQQIIWSMAVQHGRAKSILASAALRIKNLTIYSVSAAIHEMYQARRRYITSFMQGELLRSLLERYQNEEIDAIKLAKNYK